MAGLRPHLKGGPETHLVSTNLVGGTLVEPDGVTGKVKPSVANSTAVLGLALGDAAATAGFDFHGGKAEPGSEPEPTEDGWTEYAPLPDPPS